MKKILLISNKMMHYRVSIYNHFYNSFKELGYEWIVRANQIQKENRFKLLFDFKEVPFDFDLYKAEIEQIQPDFVIVFLHIKDKIIWPLMSYLKKKKIPIILWTKGANLDDPNNFIRNLFFRSLHNRSDGIILYSPNEKKYIMKKNQHKISVANNTINFSDFPVIHESKEAIKKELNIPFKKVVLFVGRMGISGERKKVDHLVEIFREIDDTDIGLVIVGSGMSDAIRARVNPKNTLVLGEIHDPEQVQISRIFKMSDLFVIPGHIGLGVNQAFFWGLPMVTEEGKQPPEIQYLINGRNGYIVKEDDLTALKGKMLYLLQNDSIREEFSKHAREDILENASTEKMFEGFLESVKKLDQ